MENIRGKLEAVAKAIMVLAILSMPNSAIADDNKTTLRLEHERADVLRKRVLDLSDEGEVCHGADPGEPFEESLYSRRVVFWMNLVRGCVSAAVDNEKIPYPPIPAGYECSFHYQRAGETAEIMGADCRIDR